MIDLIQEAQRLQEFLDLKSWDFCFVGGIALQRWGEPRLTQDIDLTLLTNFENEDEFIESLLRLYSPRLSNAAEFAKTRRMLLLKNQTGIGIDISLGGLPFEIEMVKRSAYQEYLDDVKLKIISPEDLIIMKSVARRAKDWLDIETVIIRQTNLDWKYIVDSLEEFAEILEDKTLIPLLIALKDTYYQK